MHSTSNGESIQWPSYAILYTEPIDLFYLATFYGLGTMRNDEKQKSKGVALGFSQGKLKANEDGVLLAEGCKRVYMMYFKKLDNIDENQIRALLFEAAMIDEQFARKKK